MKPPLSHLPLLPVTIAVAAGIVMGRYLSWEWALLPLSIAIISLIFKRKGIAVTSLGCALGVTTMTLNSTPPVTSPLGDDNTTFIALIEQVKENESGYTVIASVDQRINSTEVASFKPLRCQLIIPSILPDLSAGDIVAFKATLKPIEITTDLPDEFTLEEYYFANDISATAFVPQPDIKTIGEAGGVIWELRRWSDSLSDKILRLSLSHDCARFLSATLLGDRELLAPEIQENFTDAGIAHVLALSGMHVGIIALIASIILFPLTAWRGRRVSSWLLLLILWGYAIMTGMSPSITRATIMATLIVGAYMLQRSHSSGNALCCAALIITVFDPKALFSVSFQLSFAAVAAILVFIWWSNRLPIYSSWIRKLIQVIGVPIAATIGTGIISTFYFHQFPTYFLLSNIPVVILLPFFVGGGILLLIINSLFQGAEPAWLVGSLDNIYELIEWISSATSSLPGATISGIYIDGWTVATWITMSVFLGVWAYKKRPVWGYMSGVALIGSIALLAVSAPKPSEKKYYITRETYHTNIVVNNTDRLTILTTSHPGGNDDIRRNCELKYRDYMGRRAIDSLEIINLPGDCVTDILGDRLRIVNTTTYNTIPSHVDYLLVCRGFKGDILRLVAATPADSIILSDDINSRRRSRYLRELATPQ